jgi:hypothetical protein
MMGNRAVTGKATGTTAPRRDEGLALIVVIGIAAVLSVLVTTALSVSLGGLVKARADQDWNGAIAAAYAGVDEYKSKLANDNTYMRYGNPDAPFSATSKAAGALALPTGSGTNPAFGIGPAGTWASVAGSGGTASYRYEVDNSNYWSAGVLRLQSTGRVGNQTRSIVVNLKQPGFIDYLYFTNFELPDPAISGVPASCATYKWQVPVRDDNICGKIQFGSSDVINGPLHTNDTILTCSATFNGPVTTANTAAPPRYTKASGCSAPTFAVPGSPAYSPIVAMPPSNAQMKDETRTDIPALVPRPGCLYTGPTSIVFNADGTMRVRSPWTKATRVVGNPVTAVGTPPAGSSDCGTPGDPAKTLAQNANTLAGATGQVITVPAKNLIYVQGVPISRTADPNYWSPTSYPAELTCTGLARSHGSGNGLGYPTTDEYAADPLGVNSYDCRSGDAFVQGQLRGAVTISAANYLYVTGNITYQDPKTDVLGLVAENAVWVWNPMKCTSSCSSMSNTPLLTDNARTIHAAILSVNHTFQVQNHTKGNDRGTLTVSGAIAQNFRGAVGTGSTGYAKNYLYDQRFRNIAPPKFMVPVSTTYGVSVQVEVGKAFNPDGSAG